MQIFCRVVQRLFLSLVSATLRCILSHCLLHLRQVELGRLVALADKLASDVGIRLLVNLLHYMFVGCILAFLGFVSHFDACVLQIFLKLSFLTTLDQVTRNVIHLVDLGDFCLSFHVWLPVGVLRGG